MQNGFPTSSELRRLLLFRINHYCRVTGSGPAALSKRLTNNPAFFQWFKKNGNITFRLWDQCNERLTKLERRAGMRAPKPPPRRSAGRKRKKPSGPPPSKPVGSVKEGNAMMTKGES